MMRVGQAIKGLQLRDIFCADAFKEKKKIL